MESVVESVTSGSRDMTKKVEGDFAIEAELLIIVLIASTKRSQISYAISVASIHSGAHERFCAFFSPDILT